jgi:hypothetical protein
MMPKKWPWFGYEPYLNKPIKEIRSEFNIKPVSRQFIEKDL